MFHEAGEATKDPFRHERVTIIDENGRGHHRRQARTAEEFITLLRMLTLTRTYAQPALVALAD